MPESVHRKLERVRPPRVHITYDVEVGDAIQLKELPFVMGVLGDFSGNPAEALPRLKDRKFVEVTPDNFDDVLKSMKPRLQIKVDNKLKDDGSKLGMELKFESLDDFAPDRVAQQVEPLRKLLELRQQLADLRGSLQGNDKLEEILQSMLNDEGRLNQLKNELQREEPMAKLETGAQAAPGALNTGRDDQFARANRRPGRFGTDQAQRDRGRDLVKNFVSEVLEGAITVRPDTESMLNARIAEIDRLLSLQLNAVMHNPEFQRLEATWRGLKYLLNQTETSTMLKIKVLNVKKNDLLKDLQKAPEFDQSALFKKVYEEEFGVFGGAPFGALVGDYEFGRGGQDIELLEKISQVAAAAHAPFITSASPQMFNLESYTQLDSPRDLAKIFESSEYAKWKAFRDTEDSRYVALTAPRMLLAIPMARRTCPWRRSTTKRASTVPRTTTTYGEIRRGLSGRASLRRSRGSDGARQSAVSRAAG
jgi:type VI secretion system protein ImpC